LIVQSLPLLAKSREREVQRVGPKRRPWPLAINPPITSFPCKVKGKDKRRRVAKKDTMAVINHLIASFCCKVEGKGRTKSQPKKENRTTINQSWL